VELANRIDAMRSGMLMSKRRRQDADWAATGRPLGRRGFAYYLEPLAFQKRFQSLRTGRDRRRELLDRISFLAPMRLSAWSESTLRRFCHPTGLPLFL